MLRFKVDIESELRSKGVTAHTAKVSKVLAQSTFTKFKLGEVPTGSIDTICKILECQPGDIIEWIPDESAAENK